MEAQNRVQEILFVDDDEKIRKGVYRLFRQHQVPWQYEFAEGTDDALAIMRDREVDAVISDIRMPGRDGFDLLTHLRKSDPWTDLPIVMLTGLDNPGLKSKALDLGATDLLNKPVNPDELLARIRSVLQIKRCQDIIKNQNVRLEELVRRRTEVLEATRLDMIWRLAKAAEFRSNETGNHVIRVGYYSKALAEALGLGQERSEMVFLTSPLHDLGKIGIPDNILMKQGVLTTEEFEIMKTHCRIGQDLLSQQLVKPGGTLVSNGMSIGDLLLTESNPFLQMAANIAAYHHEQWQGGGYPYGIAGVDIPLEARIVTISDVYDALRSKRVYKPGINHSGTMEIMRKECGIRFDPHLFAVFERCQEQYNAIHDQYADG